MKRFHMLSAVLACMAVLAAGGKEAAAFEANQNENAPKEGPILNDTFEGFASSLVEAINDRYNIQKRELNDLPEDAQPTEYFTVLRDAAADEMEFLSFYEDYTYEDLNQETIRSEYLQGLHLQAEADPENEAAFVEDWVLGWRMRASAVADLCLVQGAIADVDLPVEVWLEMTRYTGRETEQETSSVYFVQAMLAENGYIGGEKPVDGHPGAGTYGALRLYLRDVGMLIPCTVINRNLVMHLIEAGVVTEDSFTYYVHRAEKEGHELSDDFTYWDLMSIDDGVYRKRPDRKETEAPETETGTEPADEAIEEMTEMLTEAITE